VSAKDKAVIKMITLLAVIKRIAEHAQLSFNNILLKHGFAWVLMAYGTKHVGV